MILSDVAKSFSIATSVAPTTNDLSFNVTYTDADTGLEDPRVSLSGTFNDGATSFIPNPTANTVNEVAYVRKAIEVSVFNNDTAGHTILISIEDVNGLASVPIYQFDLGINERAQYTVDQGWQTYDANGLKKNTDLVVVNKNFAVRLDKVSGTVSYVGQALPGSSPASAVWMIKRLTEVAGDLTIEYADGNDDYDNVWDNRLILSYS